MLIVVQNQCSAKSMAQRSKKSQISGKSTGFL
nr:MAG TPA: hypothetical protein [Caudoviricetes sp.]